MVHRLLGLTGDACAVDQGLKPRSGFHAQFLLQGLPGSRKRLDRAGAPVGCEKAGYEPHVEPFIGRSFFQGTFKVGKGFFDSPFLDPSS